MSTCFLISDLHIDNYLGPNPEPKDIKIFLNRVTVKADSIIVAGDISDFKRCTKKTLDVLSDMYNDVYWCMGNHEMISHFGELSALNTHWLRLNVTNTRIHLLDGTIKSNGSSLIGGAMGYCDFSYAIQHFKSTPEKMHTKWYSTFDGKHMKLGFEETPKKLFDAEYSKLNLCVSSGCNVMVSHFGPYPINIRNRFHNESTGFYYFNGEELLKQMAPNTTWCFGHTHDYYKETVGNVTLMCNPLGFEHESRNTVIPKEEFVFNI